MKMILKIFFIFLFGNLALAYGNPRVLIEDGELEGTILTTKNGREIFGFQGIPYAKPPIGELRFKPPQKNEPWKGIKEVKKNHAVCPQTNSFLEIITVEGVEDCLFLNVYTPKLPFEKINLLPVMVFIHGGAFISGSGNSYIYGPDLLLDKDVVLVVPNYRLGALGFLSTGDEVLPGNNGLKDQSLALKWVKNNIEKFGGNPESITLFGESAGAASAHYHMLSPLSKGLFHRVISQSGVANSDWAVAPKGENIQQAKKLAKLLNCPSSSSQEMVKCLRDIDPTDIIKKDKDFREWSIEPIIPFKPTVEPDLPGAFLTDRPENLMLDGKFEDVPWIVGLTREEGLLRAAAYYGSPQLFDELNVNFNNLTAIIMLYKPYVKDIESIGNKIREFYFGKNVINKETSKKAIIDFYSDGWFSRSIDQALRIHKKVAKSPAFIYLFAHNSSTSLSQLLGDPENYNGVCHGDDLQYLFPFGNGLFPNKQHSEGDKKITKLLTSLWYNFAISGHPTPHKDELVENKWTPMESNNLEYYHIDANDIEMRTDLFKERMEFWRSLEPYLNNKVIVRDQLLHNNK